MDFVGFKTWQWMIIGTVAGAAVGFAWTNQSNDLDRTGDKTLFRRLVLSSAGAIAKKQPATIRNIVVKEPELDPSKVLVYPVTYEYLPPTNRGFWQQLNAAANNGGKAPVQPAPTWVSSGIYATTPFNRDQSVTEFLKSNKIPFTDRSGAGKYVPIYYGAGAGLVLIGLLWPAAIRLMVGAGLAKPPPPTPRKAPKHRTGEDVDEMMTKPAVKTIDAGALGALNDRMEANLAAGLDTGGPRTTTPAHEAEPVSVLMTSGASKNTSDPTERAPMTPEEKKEFGGEYYPVARTVKKDGDTASPH